MRSDHIKRHAQSHKDILVMTDEEARDELRARHVTAMRREDRRQEIEEIAQQENIPIDYVVSSSTLASPDISTLDRESLRVKLLHGNQEYLNKIELGKEIAAIIDEGTVREESLTRIQKEALDLHRKQMPRIDIQSVELRSWQKTLMKVTSKPSDRNIFWVCGFTGNEGKSWLQSYLETFYGYARVVRLDLRNTTSNILRALTKRPLQTTDIFLFNDTRASDKENQNYAVLEHIKDGSAVSSKYDCDILTFKIPNIVIVFSNNKPEASHLSTDRWKIFSIRKGVLEHLNTRGGKIEWNEEDHLREYGGVWEKQFYGD